MQSHAAASLLQPTIAAENKNNDKIAINFFIVISSLKSKLKVKPAKRHWINRNRLWLYNHRRVIYSVKSMYWMIPSLYGRVIKWVNIWSANYYASMSIVVARSNLLLLRFLLLWLLPLLFAKPHRSLYRSSKALK